MQIIDIHTHIYPDPIAHKAAESIRSFYQIGGSQLDGTVAQLLECNRQAGIQRSVILPVGLKPDHVAHINDFILEQTKLHPEFTGFGTVHAGMDNITQETERIINIGLKGIKMHPDSQVFPIDDKRLFPVYEILQDRLPVIFHMGDHRFDYSHPSRLRKLLEQFPRLKVIAAHFGGYSMYQTAYDCLYDKNCFFDISSSLMFMEKGVAERYIGSYGAERMIYGSDFPLWDPREEVKRFLDLNLTQQQREQIAYKTALHILGEN